MNQYKAERILTTAYITIICFVSIGSISMAIAWNHWMYVLDTCVDTNCGCILHGRSTFTYFTGGDVSHCHFAVYGLLPVILFCIILGSYHMYRVCIMSVGRPDSNEGHTTIRSRNGESITMVSRVEDSREEDVTYKCWIPGAVIGIIMTIYSLTHVAMLTDGYYKSCNQYRFELVKILRASGNAVSVIQGRLQCGAIYDFMDYLQPDVRDRRRGDFINTSAALQIALVSFWISLGLWGLVVAINIMLARNNRTIRG